MLCTWPVLLRVCGLDYSMMCWVGTVSQGSKIFDLTLPAFKGHALKNIAFPQVDISICIVQVVGNYLHTLPKRNN